ncbi:MAG: glycosyltransferase [Proteobacteria bacterium]|nr:glycosyltransferase [Pseudomonadota bacterium]
MRKPAPDAARVIAVNRFYWPDHSATSQLLTDLMIHLAGEGTPVTVIASRMLYDDPGQRLPARETRDGVDIRRVWTSRMGRMGRGGLAGRALDYLTFYLSALLAVFRATRRGDVILVKTDPPLISVITWIVAGLKGARVVTWNQDLFPEFAAALGISLARGRFGRALRWLRNRSLLGAEMNIAINESMAGELTRQGVDPRRIRVIHNWGDAGLLPVNYHNNPLRADWGLDGAFVICYSGNLGRAHMAAKVADLVRRTHDLPGLAWLFIGGGSGLVQIERLIAETGASNIQIRPYQSREDLSLSLSLADLHLVSLEPACEGLLSPSKLYGIMAAGRPTLFLGKPDGALARGLADHRIGVSLDVERPERWRAEIEALRAAPRRGVEMGARARALSDSVYHPECALGALGEVLAAAARAGRGAAPGRSGSPAPAGPASGVLARLDGSRPGPGPGWARPDAAFFALGVVITLLALYPGLKLPPVAMLEGATAIFNHVAAFGLLIVVGAAGWGLQSWLIAGVSSLAAWLELGQMFSPGRVPDLADLAASILGVAIGCLLVRHWRLDRRSA